MIFDRSIKAVYYRNIQDAANWPGTEGPEIMASRTSEDDRKGHLFNWSLTEDLTSSHDMTLSRISPMVSKASMQFYALRTR